MMGPILAQVLPLPADRAEFARFYAAYYRVIDRQSREVTAAIARLTPPERLAAPAAPPAGLPGAMPMSTGGTRS